MRGAITPMATEGWKPAEGGAAGVIHAVDCATTDCQPNVNIEALRVFMFGKKVECRPVWKPMHKQPVYRNGAQCTMRKYKFGKVQTCLHT